MRPAPLLSRSPGDRVRAEDWDGVQLRLEGALAGHRHTLKADALASSSQIRARHLDVGTMKVGGRELREPLSSAAQELGQEALARTLSVQGGVITGDLDIQGSLSVDGDLIVDGDLSMNGGPVPSERPLPRRPEDHIMWGGQSFATTGDRYVPMPWGARNFHVSTLTLATIYLDCYIQGAGVQPNAGSAWHCALSLFIGRGDQLMNEALIALKTLRPATLPYEPDDRVAIRTCEFTSFYVQSLRLEWDHHAQANRWLHTKTPRHVTRSFLLDPGEWTYQLRASISGEIEALPSAQLFLMPLPVVGS